MRKIQYTIRKGKTLKTVKYTTQKLKYVNAAIEANKIMKTLWQKSEIREEREMREYCKANEICNTKGNKKADYYAVNRGKRTIEWKRKNWGKIDQQINYKIIMKNKAVLIYGENKGIVELAKTITQVEGKIYEIKLEKLDDEIKCKLKNTLEIPEEIEIDGEKYKAREIGKMLIENNVEIFEIM